MSEKKSLHDILSETNLTLWGSSRFPSYEKYLKISETKLKDEIRRVIKDNFRETSRGEDCDGCQEREAEYRYNKIYLCKKCLNGKKIFNEETRDIVNKVMDYYYDKFSDFYENSSENNSESEEEELRKPRRKISPQRKPRRTTRSRGPNRRA